MAAHVIELCIGQVFILAQNPDINLDLPHVVQQPRKKDVVQLLWPASHAQRDANGQSSNPITVAPRVLVLRLDIRNEASHDIQKHVPVPTAVDSGFRHVAAQRDGSGKTARRRHFDPEIRDRPGMVKDNRHCDGFQAVRS